MKHPGVQKIIDILKNVDNSPKSEMGFDMVNWYNGRQHTSHPCGTACCIAGWAQAQIENGAGIHPTDALREFCDLQDVESSTIWDLVSPDFSFCPPLSYVKLKDLTLPMAIKVLEIFRDTGKIAWHSVYLGLV